MNTDPELLILIQIEPANPKYDQQLLRIKNDLKKALLYLEISGSELSVSIVNNESIQNLNLKYRNIDSPTDVLSFEQNEVFENRRILGDIIISTEKVEEQASEKDRAFYDELQLLLIHGLLHLLGYDHDTKEKEVKMFQLQDEIIQHVNKESIIS